MSAPNTSPGVAVRFADRGAGEGDERGVGQGAAQVAGVAVEVAVVAAVGLVGDDDDVPPVREQGVRGAGFALGLGAAELLQRGEVDPAGAALAELGAQLLAGADLAGLLGQQGGALEAVEQLGVELGAVGEDDDGGVRQLRVAHHLRGVQLHLHGLAGALGVPDHADPSVGADGLDGGADGLGHGEVLVRFRDAFGEPGGVLVEGDEVVEELAEALEVEQAVQRPVDLGVVLAVGSGLPHGDGVAVVVHVPGGEVVPGGERRAVAGVDAVGGDHERGEAERHRQLGHIGLQLVERGLGGRGSGAGLFELHDRQRQPVDVGDHVETALGLPAAHGHLVHDPVTVQRRVTGEEADHGGTLAPVVVDVGDAAVPVAQDRVEAVVLGDRVL
jgi:hypothetical protein